MRSLIGPLLVLAGCGRLHFDPIGGGDASVFDSNDSNDGPAVVFPTFGAPQVSPISTIYDDWTPELSRNGLMLFGAAYGSPGSVGEDDVWATSRTTAAAAFPPWALVPNLGTAGRDFGPALSPDGLTLYYGSGGAGFADPPAIYSATRADVTAAFGSPAEVTALTGGTVTRDPSFSADGLTVYFDSDRTPSMGGYDIWYATRATLTSPWSTPVSLAEINTAATERDPFVSSDGRTLYFASDRPGGIGSQDLWVAIRQTTQMPFGTPVNLTTLNSSASQGNPTISDDGVIMWDTDRPGGPGGAFGYDIWEAQLQLQ